MPDEFAGPRKVRYFAYLLVIFVFLYVLGEILSLIYDFTLLESATEPLVDEPMVLFELAGILALLAGAVILGGYAQDYLG